MRNQPNYALLSVSDKTGIVEFARGLHELGIKLLSTGGTAKAIKEAGIPVTEVSEFTGSPEIFDGRVKTLHPKVHGGILNIRDNETHQKTAKEMNIENIDIVAVNLYPFEKVAGNASSTLEDIIENIDIGGPAMVRSAAKNHAYVTIVVHPHDYDKVLQEIKAQGSTCIETRRVLAAKAYSHTALYDTVISNYLGRKFQLRFREEFTVGGRLIQSMRYGENPHQDSAFYKEPLMRETGVCYAEQKHGKELSFNNIVDLNSAEELLKEFKNPACVIIKHNNPCGVAEADTLSAAYDNALACDPVSAFGGIFGFNREVDEDVAKKISEIFVEVVAAPAFSEKAIEILSKKPSIRIMVMEQIEGRSVEYDVKKVTGGYLLQDRDLHMFNDFKSLPSPTKRKPTDEEIKALEFAWKVAKHVKSNAIVYVKGTAAIGVGAGQMSRIDSTKIAHMKAEQAFGKDAVKGAVMASDAFFPFRDNIDAAAAYGVTAIVSPGGSVRDEEVIQAANEHNIAMIFTGIRHFRH